MAYKIEGDDVFEEVDHPGRQLCCRRKSHCVSAVEDEENLFFRFIVPSLCLAFLKAGHRLGCKPKHTVLVGGANEELETLGPIKRNLQRLNERRCLSLSLATLGVLDVLDVLEVVQQSRATVRPHRHRPVPPNNDDSVLEEDAIHVDAARAVQLAEHEARGEVRIFIIMWMTCGNAEASSVA